MTIDERKRIAQALEAAARGEHGAKLNSVSSSCSDSSLHVCRVHSNGFVGEQRGTMFSISAAVSVKDPDGRRPQEYAYATSRWADALAAAERVGAEASTRAVGRIGAQKPRSEVLPMVVDNRAAGRLVGLLLGPLSAQALQQKRSFLDGKLSQPIGSAYLTFADDPLLPRGLGSRLFDDEGLAARRMPVFEAGVLASYYIDDYYGRKLGLQPTTGGMSNLSWRIGSKSQAELLADVKEGILVTGFLGGNSNGTTGDFSLGVVGFRVRAGSLAEPVSELNIAANQLEFWKRLVAVGNDPFPSSASRTPTLVFEGTQFAGA